MKKYIILAIFIVIFGGFFVFNKTGAAEDPALNQKEVADLAKPAVVKVIQHVRGSAVVPSIDVDFKNLTVTTRSDMAPRNIQIDEYLTGSGMVVSPDGFILTNSHIISYQTIKNLVVSDFIYDAIENGYVGLGEEEAKILSDTRSPESVVSFGEEIANYILTQSKFDLQKNVVVLNPISQKESLKELVADGFPATVVSVNDNFFRDSRDAALLKIDQLNLPAIELNPDGPARPDDPGHSGGDVSTGKQVYIFGYPSTAEVDEKDVLVPTFTQGTISATKDSPDGKFKILQTDAKISRGSSGGPLLDENGQVIGLVTFITSDLTKQDGDSFAFAIPIKTVLEIVETNKVTGELPKSFDPGTYGIHFEKGLGYFRDRRCEKAMAEFDSARQVNENFPVAGFLGPYVKQCEEIIGAGRSIDTPWELVRFKLSNTKYLIGFVILGMLALVAALSLLWLWLFRRVRKDEKELDNVEEYMHLNLEDGTPIPGKSCICVTDKTLEKLKPKKGR